MTELFVLEPAAADEPSDRIPEGLPVGGAERGPLERALRNAGLAIASVPFDVLIDAPDGGDDRRELRAAVTAVVHAAADTELERLRAAVQTDPDDGLDVALWGPAPDSVAVSKAAFADLQDQFAARRQLRSKASAATTLRSCWAWPPRASLPSSPLASWSGSRWVGNGACPCGSSIPMTRPASCPTWIGCSPCSPGGWSVCRPGCSANSPSSGAARRAR